MQELVGKHCKIVFRDNNQDKVIKGKIQAIDDFTISVLGDRDNNLVVIGKSVLVSLKEDFKEEKDDAR